MHQAQFQFYGDLPLFLPRTLRRGRLSHSFQWQTSIKDMVESLGVPHCEVEALLVNGEPVSFSYLVQPADGIQVYPHGLVPNPDAPLLLRGPFIGWPRFVLDTHLGRLSNYLRMLGFDTLYRNDYPDDELARISAEEYRILLTRDVGLLKRSLVTYGYYVRNTESKARAREIVRRFGLAHWVEPFRHCLKCNGLLSQVAKEDIRDRLDENAARYYDEFYMCVDCGQVYWKGSHYERMQNLLAEILE